MNAGFAKLTDYFGLEDDNLKLVESSDGVARSILRTSHTGGYDASDQTNLLKNPYCIYEVVKDTDIEFTLGKAFTDGYFITAVEINTSVGKFPRVRVQATANEGADAINLWTLSIPVLAKATAQNLLGFSNSPRRLNSVKLVAKCDPVVIMDDKVPIASDVVHGMIEISANIVDPSGAGLSNPVSSAYNVRSCVEAASDTDYIAYNLVAERSL